MRFCSAVGAALILASCATASFARERDRHPFGKPDANPSAIVAAEIAFARLAREEGQWTAFRETAAEDAVLATPELVDALEWLKNRADPPQPVEWQPHKIYISCDGSMGAAIGAWQDAKGKTGYFTTIWEQQDFGKRRRRGQDIEYKWVFDHGAPVDEPIAEPDFIETRVASCKGKVGAAIPPARGANIRSKQSQDRTFLWVAEGAADKSYSLSVTLWNGEAFEAVIEDQVDAPAP